jgi:hypothetical protein
MSSSDISRFLRQPGKHYAGARLQQGRILTDADFNEGSWLGEEDRRKALADFGPRGSPDDGFSIGAPLADKDRDPAQPPALKNGDVVPIFSVQFNDDPNPVSVRPVSIRAGAFHLGGMRFELEKPQPFMFQRDFLQMSPADIGIFDLALAAPFTFYYLNAWEQCISAVEDGEFLEPALGGVDTSMRVRRMRRVQMRSVGTEATCEQAFNGLIADFEAQQGDFDRATGELKSKGRLFFRAAAATPAEDCATCNPSPSARFLGADNQTLRVMLTQPNNFVWSLDDGAPLYAAMVSNLDLQNPSEVTVTLVTPPRDEEHFPLVNRVVEILPFSALLDRQQVDGSLIDPHFNKAAAEIGAFTRVATPYDPVNKTFTVDLSAPGLDAARAFTFKWDGRHPDAPELMLPPPDPPPAVQERAFYVRFWHMADPSKGQEIEISTDSIDPLGTTGLVPNFTQPGRPGDFWIASLRPDSPQRPIVPYDFFAPDGTSLDGRAPDGPRHFYAPLAFLRGHLPVPPTTLPDGSAVIDENVDCRPRIRPLADDGCTKVTVGDCRNSIGQFTLIQDAIDALPPEGGVVTILPGFYQEAVQIVDRPGVILEGCGDATVLESSNVFSDVITISGNSPGVRLRSLAVNVDLRSITVLGASDFKMSALHVTGASAPSSGFTGMVSISESTNVTLEGLRIENSGRVGLEIIDCTGVEASGLDVAGSPDTQTGGGFATAAIRTVNVLAVKVRDSSVHTFAQVCVSDAGSRNMAFERLTLTSDQFQNQQPARAAIDIDDSTDVSIVGCNITQLSVAFEFLALETVGTDAAVVVQGIDVLVENNEIVAPEVATPTGAAVWGGVQVRGSSVNTIVRGNHIVAGVGHGITLGSVIWQDSNQLSPPQRFGAGKGQLDGSASAGFAATGVVGPDRRVGVLIPLNEGILFDVVLAGNRIERMSTNGISTFSMLGVTFQVDSGATEFIQLDHLRIEGNIILDNVKHPPASIANVGQTLMIQPALDEGVPLAQLQLQALGGIVLSDVGTGAEIRGNLVSGNGAAEGVLPINGIFIVVGEAITISNNRILNNGAVPTGLQAGGIRGGIVVVYAGTGAPAALSDLQNEVFPSGGNDLPNDGSSVRVLNNVVRQLEGRALYIIAAGPVAVIGNFLASQGFHGSNEDLFAIGDLVLIQDIGGPWERFNIGAQPPVFEDYGVPPPTFNYMFNANPDSPRLFVGVGGQVSFLNNQTIFDFFVSVQPPPGVPLAIFPLALMTLDHLSVTGNQVAFRERNLQVDGIVSPLPEGGVVNEPVLAHMFAAGATADVSGNRFSEAFGLVNSSVWTLAELVNYTTYNQMTHQFFSGISAQSSSEPNNPTLLTDGNQVLFAVNPPVLSGFSESLHLFFELLFRTNLNLPPGNDPGTDVPPPPGD